MKKPYMHAVIGPSEGDCVLIILFQLYGSKTWLFYSGWASMTPQLWKKNIGILKKKNKKKNIGRTNLS